MTGPVSRLDRDRNLAELLEDAFAIYRRHAVVALLLTAAVVVPVELIFSGIGLGQLTSGYERSASGAALGLGSLVSLLVTTPLVTGMLVHLALADGSGRPVDARSAAAAGLEVFTPLLVAVLLYTAGVLVGFLALIVPGIILAIRWSVVAPAVVVEGERGTAALRRSWELVTGNSWWVLGVLLVQGIAVGVVSGVIGIPADAIARGADAQVVTLLASIVAQILTLPFTAFVTALLFFTLRARKGEVAPPPAGVMPPRDGEPREGPLWGGREPEGPGPEAPGGWEPPAPPR